MKRLVPLLALLVCAACGSRQAGPQVVVFTSHDLIFSEPILAEFEARTGIRVLITGDTEATKTTGLVNRLIARSERPECDVFWNNEVVRTCALAERGLLESYAPSTAEGIPSEYLDPLGRWTGFAARARVILYNTELVAPEEVPRSIFELVEPRYRGRVAIANPLFGTTATHVAALYAALGAERAEAFLSDLKANGVRIVAGNALARNMVVNGEIAICLTDTDDANGAILKDKPVEMVYPDQGGLGTLVIPNTAALIRGGPNPEHGRRLVDFLVSRETEQALARLASAQMPVRAGLEAHGPRFDLARLDVMELDWAAVAAQLEVSVPFVQETFLD